MTFRWRALSPSWKKRGRSNFPVTPTRVSSYRKIAPTPFIPELFGLDAGELGLLAVGLELGLDEFLEVGGRVGDRDGAELDQALAHFRVFHRGAHLAPQLVDDRGRRAGGRGHPGPAAGLLVGKPPLPPRRGLRRGPVAPLAGAHEPPPPP